MIVSETSGRWAVAWRTAFADSRVSLIEVAGLASAFGRFRDDSQSVLAFEATEACAEEGFALLHASRERYPDGGVVVLLDRPLAMSAPLWHEAGALAVVSSPRQLALAARLIRRFLDTRQIPPDTFREAVWQRMPCSESE